MAYNQYRSCENNNVNVNGINENMSANLVMWRRNERENIGK